MTKDQILISQYLDNHPELAIAEIGELSSTDIAQLVLSLDTKNQKVIFGGLSSRKASKVLEKIPTQDSVELITELPFLVSEAIIRNLSNERRSSVLELLPVELAKPLRRSLSYHKNQVGSHLDPNVPSLLEEMSIQDCLNYIKDDHLEAHQHFFVLNNKRTLVGCLRVTALLTTEVKRQVKSVMMPITANITAEMNVKDVLENWNEAFFELPVTNLKGEFIGIVTRRALRTQAGQVNESIHSTIKAGNALADLYLIGLTSLMGNSDTPQN